MNLNNQPITEEKYDTMQAEEPRAFKDSSFFDFATI
jgi:hypothetical protein